MGVLVEGEVFFFLEALVGAHIEAGSLLSMRRTFRGNRCDEAKPAPVEDLDLLRFSSHNSDRGGVDRALVSGARATERAQALSDLRLFGLER